MTSSCGYEDDKHCKKQKQLLSACYVVFLLPSYIKKKTIYKHIYKHIIFAGIIYTHLLMTFLQREMNSLEIRQYPDE